MFDYYKAFRTVCVSFPPHTYISVHIYFHLIQEKATGRQVNNSPSEKKGTLRTVRQFMKLGKQRHQRQTSRDSSTEDEGR